MNDGEPLRIRLDVEGVVQGVGFRPFIYGLARRCGLTGRVGNTSRGVLVELQGTAADLNRFRDTFAHELPPLARVDQLWAEPATLIEEAAFVIEESLALAGESTPIPPDIAVCGDCLREMFDPADRRYLYPFINCTNCGPRFTITEDIPYDRANTTMCAFPMCATCSEEYHDPGNRRFHAQPNACPVCGPHVWLRQGGMDSATGQAAIEAALASIDAGATVAIKGIGGFHLACDATNQSAVARLRERKGRRDKPFAVMAATAESVSRAALFYPDERKLLESPRRPIVLLDKKQSSPLADGIAPGSPQFGFLLPYAPLHHLLFRDRPDRLLVMTSGNRSEEPIARENDEALERLSGMADAFLLHNRQIHVVCDDSVTAIAASAEQPIRRSRGYAPLPVNLMHSGPSVLAVGAELKAAFCLTRGNRAYMSQHIGDMENLETLVAFRRALDHFTALYRVRPERVACDLHPGYLSSRFAREYAAELNLPLITVQHHHAHLAAVMADAHDPGDEPVIGLCWDGTGYGTDSAIWGGEVLLGGYGGFERIAHLKYLPLPGGDSAIKFPYRMALAALWSAGLDWDSRLACVQAATPTELRVLETQLTRNVNVTPTSSIGRLFDAAAAIAGVRQQAGYEAQAAIEFEAAACGIDYEEGYEFSVSSSGQPAIIDAAPVLRSLTRDAIAGVSAARISARFHYALAELAVTVCRRARERTGANKAGLSGGAFQNRRLLRMTIARLERDSFHVLRHCIVPPNDGGLALGQACIAARA